MKQSLLLLEDDPNLGFMLKEHLEAHGFEVTLLTNGEEGLTATRKRRFDLCLVDIMMPTKDGFTFARELRLKDSLTPIIFLTAKSLKEDRIEGFKIGGDDYVTKPFSMEELLLRIAAVLKRTSSSGAVSTAKTIFQLGKFRFDPEHQILRSATRSLSLTSKESQLLELLYSRKNTLVPRNDILKVVWGDDSYFNGRSLDVFITKLRKHLASDRSLEIKNIHGKGYKLIVGG
jgi:DNA-binding response OmpR family regulator